MSSLAALANIKDQLPTEAAKTEVVIKGNINSPIVLTDHAVERYYQRELNNTNSDIDTMRKHLTEKIKNEGVIGYYDPKLGQEYVAIVFQGLFIKKGSALTTYISVNELNRPLTEIYIKLRRKGEKVVTANKVDETILADKG